MRGLELNGGRRLRRPLGLRVVDVPYAQPYSTHPYYGVLFELEALGLISFLGVFADDIPQLLFWIRVDTLQADLMLVVNPIPLLSLLFRLLWALVHYSQYLAVLLIFFAKIHSLSVPDVVDIGFLGR